MPFLWGHCGTENTENRRNGEGIAGRIHLEAIGTHDKRFEAMSYQ